MNQQPCILRWLLYSTLRKGYKNIYLIGVNGNQSHTCTRNAAFSIPVLLVCENVMNIMLLFEVIIRHYAHICYATFMVSQFKQRIIKQEINYNGLNSGLI